MATHADILSRAGKDAEVAALLHVNSHQVRDWRLRNSIPGEKWKAIADAGICTLEELAEIAASRVSSPTQSAA